MSESTRERYKYGICEVQHMKCNDFQNTVNATVWHLRTLFPEILKWRNVGNISNNVSSRGYYTREQALSGNSRCFERRRIVDEMAPTRGRWEPKWSGTSNSFHSASGDEFNSLGSYFITDH